MYQELVLKFKQDKLFIFLIRGGKREIMSTNSRKLPKYYMFNLIISDHNSHNYDSFTVSHGNVKGSKLYLSSNDVTLLPNKPNWLLNNIAVYKVKDI